MIGAIAGSNGRGAIPTSGLRLEYLFSNNLNDTSGNNNNGTNVNSLATFTSDRFSVSNHAINVSANNAKINFTRIDCGNEFTVSLWTNIYTMSSLNGALFQNQAADGASYISYIGGQFKIGCGAAGVLTYTPPSNNIVHLCITRTSQSNFDIYINASKLGSISGGSFNNNFYFETLGPYNQSSWQSSIDDLRIYDRALNTTEITQLYNE